MSTYPEPTSAVIAEGTPTQVKQVSAEQAEREQFITDAVLASFEGAESPRLRQLMQALVRHLHAFARETRLTEQEWSAAIAFLTAVGHITDERRQEFILLSDTLGLSMQTIAINNEAYENATEATVFGPFFVEDAPRLELGADMSFGAKGQPCWVEGQVTDTDGNPCPGAVIEAWECDEDGFYDVQYGDDRTACRAQFVADEQGRYRFWGVTPVEYPIPDDGPVGSMLEAVGRSPMRAAHLHFMVSAPGRHTLVTHIFVEGNEYLHRDSVFGVKPSLIRTFDQHDAAETAPDGRVLERDWASVRFDIVLAPAKDVVVEDAHWVAVPAGGVEGGAGA